MKKIIYNIGAVLTATAIFATSLGLAGCSNSKDQVVIYSNADDEAVTAMKTVLDSNGYEGKYLFQTLGTSELGGKLMTEGKNIEADLITMSSFYIDSAQEKNNMFLDLSFPHKTLDKYPSYYTPITAQEGALIINTDMMKENNLPYPKSIKDLANPEYKGYISVTDIEGSSTAWLMIQALISSYGEAETQEILKKIYENAGPHLESSGSGPLKKVRAGEVAIGFGLRHQAIADKNNGLPIDYIDPTEGNYVLTESLALINKEGNENPLASQMADCIINKGRSEIIKSYPMPLYEGETSSDMSNNTKVFGEKLTVDLLDKHKKLSNKCKGEN